MCQLRGSGQVPQFLWPSSFSSENGCRDAYLLGRRVRDSGQAGRTARYSGQAALVWHPPRPLRSPDQRMAPPLCPGGGRAASPSPLRWHPVPLLPGGGHSVQHPLQRSPGPNPAEQGHDGSHHRLSGHSLPSEPLHGATRGPRGHRRVPVSYCQTMLPHKPLENPDARSNERFSPAHPAGRLDLAPAWVQDGSTRLSPSVDRWARWDICFPKPSQQSRGSPVTQALFQALPASYLRVSHWP